MLPPSVREKSSSAHITGDRDTFFNVTNWDEANDGYSDWAVLKDTEGDVMAKMMHNMTSQFLYGYGGPKYKPEEQMQRMFAAPLVRKFKEYSQTDKFKDMASKIFVMLIEIQPLHTSAEKDDFDKMRDNKPPKVWRLVACHGDTNLDSFHDQIIGPAMGWRRHYHAYKFVVPSSGATFGPEKSDAIDMMHHSTSGGYFLNSEAYDVRHVLRKGGQRLCYTYDLGDSWRHSITLIGIVDRGSTIGAEYFEKYEYVHNLIGKSAEWKLTGNQLLAGGMNCPPEDSNGCEEMGNYGSILAKGKNHTPRELGLNWTDHGIYDAYKFDLKAHQSRFNKAIKYKKNPQDGTVQMVHMVNPSSSATPSDFRSHLKQKGRKMKTDGVQCEVLGKKTTSNKCANCGKQKSSNTDLKLFTCSVCKSVKYCNRDCQLEHWKAGHKHKCSSS